jgi:ferredoxin
MADGYGAARWDEVASRCLSCGNCTLACPTCWHDQVLAERALAERDGEIARETS